MSRQPSSSAESQTSPLRAADLQALFDRFVAMVPESNGYAVNVLSPINNLDVSVASGLSDVATNTKLSAMQPSRIASVTKTFTAAVVLRLAEMKRLSLTNSISTHASSKLIEVLKSGGYDTSAITIKQLLQHSSGIADYAGNEENYQGAFQQAVVSNPSKVWTRTEHVEFAVTHYGPSGQPGVEFHYSDTGYILLGDIIEQVTQQSLAEAMRSLLKFSELGLNNTYLEDSEPPPTGLLPQAHTYVGAVDVSSIDASYDLFGGGGLVATVQDVSKFFAALFTGSIFADEATLDLMLGAGEPRLLGSEHEPAHMSLYPRKIGSEQCYGHTGFTGITALYCPSLQTSITFTLLQSNTTSLQENELLKELFTMLSPPSTPSDPASNADNSSNPLDGLWRSDGYGYLLDIDGLTTTLYEETMISCLPVSWPPANGGPIPLVTSTSMDRAQLTFPGRVGSINLHRIDRLPATFSPNANTNPVTAFEVFAATFAEHYPFFANRNVDWSAVTNEHRHSVTATTTDDQLANIFADMIGPLGDAHTNIAVGGSVVFQAGRPGSPVSSFGEFVPFLQRVMASTAEYLGVELETWGNGLIAYADLPGGIGYLRFAAFHGFSETGRIDDEHIQLVKALDEILTSDRVATMKGLVIDLRVNGGGFDELALSLAGRLTDVAYAAYSKRARNDAIDPKNFTHPQLITVQPSSQSRFTGPIAILTASLTISAGEGFTQAMLSRQPEPIRIGANTQGVFSDTLQRSLPGSTVTFGLPNEDFVTGHGVSFDRFGIPPDICIPTLTETELTNATDAAMDKARELLLSAELVTRADLTKAPSSIC